jgi:predicted DNA-binding transcriptional regulator YafY
MFNNDVNEIAYRNVTKAFNERLTLEMKYFSMSQEKPIERKVDIYAKNSKYIVGFCHLRQAIRKFRLCRIMKAKVTDERYRIPKNFNKKDYL